MALLPAILGSARPEFGEGVRSTLHKGYVILFRYVDDAVEIVTVVNGRRDLSEISVDDDVRWS